MSYSNTQPIAGNQFFAGVGNTLVNNRAVYQASVGKGNLSVLRQKTGVVVIPSGYVATTAATGYLPIIGDDGLQLTIPLRAIVDNVEYSAIPFGGVQTSLNAVLVQAVTSTVPVTYTAGAPLSSASVLVSDVNLNILNDGPVTGRLSANGVWGMLAIDNTGGGGSVTTTQVNKVRVTVYYYSGQDLNN